MSEYEGKVPYRAPPSRRVDLIDLLYYEATGKMMSREEKERTLSMLKRDEEMKNE